MRGGLKQQQIKKIIYRVWFFIFLFSGFTLFCEGQKRSIDTQDRGEVTNCSIKCCGGIGSEGRTYFRLPVSLHSQMPQESKKRLIRRSGPVRLPEDLRGLILLRKVSEIRGLIEEEVGEGRVLKTRQITNRTESMERKTL